MSRLRLALGGVGLVAVAALVLAALALTGDGHPRVQIGDEELAALQAAPCPPRYEVLRAGRFARAEVEAARRGRFTINGEPVRIAPPVDWNKNPIEARSFSHTLFKFQWLDPLLFAYRARGDTAALEQALALVLDFARANPPDGEPAHPNVWDDKRSGDRGPYLAYLLRAAECEGLLGDDERELLLETMGRHIDVLTDPANYKETNHGLFADLGLTLLARQLDFMPDAQSWGDLGRERFEATIRNRTVEGEGLWLEHSAGYQILIARSLARFLAVPGNDTPGLVQLRREMHEVTGWLTMPDGKIPQFGDSDLKDVPAFALRRARNDRGILDLRESGLAVFKRDGAFLSVLASYHSDAHKHADALTFDLFDGGRRLITDTGLFHKDKDENFAFARSSRAHSVLIVDGEDFPRDGSGVYGSGIEATGTGLGYGAILATNPATVEHGARHRRLFLHAPGEMLVIVDRVEATDGERHRYARFLHFAPEVEVRERGPALELRAPDFRGTVRTNAVGGERIELARGERDPLRGMTSPSFRRWQPRWTARLRTEGRSLDHLTSVAIGSRAPRADLVSWEDGVMRLDLHRRGGSEGVRILEEDGLLRIERVPPEAAR